MSNVKLYAFADEAGKTLDAQIAAMTRNGLQGLEIRMVNGKNVSDMTKADAMEVRKALDDNGLITWSIGSPIGKIDIVKDDFEAHLDKLKNTLDVADVLGAKNIRMFSFYMPQGDDPAIHRSAVIDRLNKMCEVAAGSGIDMCHENEKGIYGDVASRCLDVLTNVPALKGIFDPANFVQSEQDTLEAWSMLHDRIKYMHIKDSLKCGQVVPAGEGDGNVPAILKMYFAQGGECLTLEPHLFEFAALRTLEREGEESKVGGFHYATPDEAFDAAVTALRRFL